VKTGRVNNNKKNTAYKSIISNKFKINNVNIIGYLIAGF
jgi:hypothetical protein